MMVLKYTRARNLKHVFLNVKYLRISGDCSSAKIVGLYEEFIFEQAGGFSR